MAFPASQTLIQDNCHEQQQEQHQLQQLPDSHKLGSAEDIDNHHAGTPIKFLPLRHVYSATSPCVGASGSSNVVSKKVRARKLTLIDGCLDDHICHQLEEGEETREGNEQVKGEPLLDSSQVIRVYSRRVKKKTSMGSSLRFDHQVEKLDGEGEGIVVKAEPLEEEGFVGDVLVGFPNKKRRVGNSELVKLGVDSSVLCRLNGPRLRESRFQYNVNTSTSVVKKRKQNSSANHKNHSDWRAKKWFLYVVSSFEF